MQKNPKQLQKSKSFVDLLYTPECPDIPGLRFEADVRPELKDALIKVAKLARVRRSQKKKKSKKVGLTIREPNYVRSFLHLWMSISDADREDLGAYIDECKNNIRIMRELDRKTESG